MRMGWALSVLAMTAVCGTGCGSGGGDGDAVARNREEFFIAFCGRIQTCKPAFAGGTLAGCTALMRTSFAKDRVADDCQTSAQHAQCIDDMGAFPCGDFDSAGAPASCLACP